MTYVGKKVRIKLAESQEILERTAHDAGTFNDHLIRIISAHEFRMAQLNEQLNKAIDLAHPTKMRVDRLEKKLEEMGRKS